MKNILILTNFSENSWNSFVYALALFQKDCCNFYMLNTTNIQENEFEDVEYDNVGLAKVKNQKDSKKEFDKLIEKIASSPLKGKHVFTPISAEKDIVEAARNQVREKEIDLIVMGTNELCPQREKDGGSITEDVITKVKCSILVVPNETRFNGLKEISFPTDYTNFYEAKLLQNIISLSNYHKSTLRFLYIAKKDETLNKEQVWNKETIQDYFVNRPHSFHSEINKNLEVSIENFIDKMSIDLIVLAAKNLNLLEQILFRPEINSIKYCSKTPFLVLHQSNY